MAARLSPGGALLRTSRLFSIPNPLPPPPPADLGSAVMHSSPTATAPFPTHLTVTTTNASRSRGDWGFKRPLPRKTTMRTTTPLVRMKELDAVESITDFASAADHTLTLEKFQELHTPLSQPIDPARAYQTPGLRERSVFEDDVDFTFLPKGKDATDAEFRRWKFKGPWLAGLSEAELAQFIEKKVRSRRPQFRQFVKEKLAAEMTRTEKQAAVERGEEAPAAVASESITDEQLTEYLRRLRQDRITLYSFVGEFLDLAPLTPPLSLTQLDNRSRAQPHTNPYAKDGPPATHPSAGLSYLRTAAFAENHPLYGPQKAHSPVQGRVLAPRMQRHAARLGVGGFVADSNFGDVVTNFRRMERRKKGEALGLATVDLVTTGGPKTFVEPASARVHPSGKISLKVQQAGLEAEAVKMETMGIQMMFNEPTSPGEGKEVVGGETDAAWAGESPAPKMRKAETDLLSSSRSYGLDS